MSVERRVGRVAPPRPDDDVPEPRTLSRTALPAWRPRKAARVLAGMDPRLARLIEAAGPPAIPQYPSSFESLARAVAYQQLAGAAARAIWGRVLALFEDGGFTPAAALRRRDATYRKAGLSGPKTRTIKDLARHVLEGDVPVERFPSLPDEEVVRALTQVKGIGPWSAEMHLIFALRRPDVWPVLDLGVRKGWARLVGSAAEPTPRELEPLGEPYRPYRSVLAWYLWRAVDAAWSPREPSRSPGPGPRGVRAKSARPPGR